MKNKIQLLTVHQILAINKGIVAREKQKHVAQVLKKSQAHLGLHFILETFRLDMVV